jgi:hypothetical protein
LASQAPLDNMRFQVGKHRWQMQRDKLLRKPMPVITDTVSHRKQGKQVMALANLPVRIRQ